MGVGGVIYSGDYKDHGKRGLYIGMIRRIRGGGGYIYGW